MRTTIQRNTLGVTTANVELQHHPTQFSQGRVKSVDEAACIYFVGPYKPIMCGIADYTSFITRESPLARWGVISFNLENYGTTLTGGNEGTGDNVCYGIPNRRDFTLSVINDGLKELKAKREDAVLWFQHEFGIWPGSIQFIAMLKNLDIPKVVTFHTLHFQSSETRTGLRNNQYSLLQILLPYVDAITVFSRGVYGAVISAFPQYSQKVHLIKHGIHSYPEISRLSRKEAKEKFNDYLLYESDLDLKTKEALHEQRIFTDPGTVVVGQTGFLTHSKNSKLLLYYIRNSLQQCIPNKRIAVVRIGKARDESQNIYSEKLRRMCNGIDKFLCKIWLDSEILPLAQRAFDINFCWPSDCTQSGVLAHALGAGAVIAGRDLEGVGETLKEAGELVDIDLNNLLLKMSDLILNPELVEMIEERALNYANEFSWENQSRRHYELIEHILSSILTRSATFSPLPIEAMSISDAG